MFDKNNKSCYKHRYNLIFMLNSKYFYYGKIINRYPQKWGLSGL